MSAGAIRFQYGRWGKPRLDGNTEDLRFNVAHAGGRAIIAVCRHFDVGADLEPLRTVRDRDRVAQLVFSDAELHQLAQSDDKDRLFLSGWTRKEAYIKALGTGFSEPVRRFSVSLADTAALLTPSACGGTVAEWTLVGLEHQTHLIAVAARAPDITVQLRIRNG